MTTIVRVTVEGQTFDVEIVDLHARPVLAIVDGETFEVWPESRAVHPVPAGDRSVDQAPPAPIPPAVPAVQPGGNGAQAVPKLNAVYAPIPGVIRSIAVKPGSVVKFGQELCVLEAMKMNNVIRASREGRIAAVHVAVGEHVRHHAILMEYAD